MTLIKLILCAVVTWAAAPASAQSQPKSLNTTSKPAPAVSASVSASAPALSKPLPGSSAKVVVRLDERTFNNRIELGFLFDKPPNIAAFITLQLADRSRVTPETERNRFLYGRLFDGIAGNQIRPQSLLIGIPADHSPQDAHNPVVIKVEDVLRLTTIDGKSVFELFLQFAPTDANSRMLGQAAPVVAPATVTAIELDRPSWLDRYEVAEGKRISEGISTVTVLPNETGALKIRLYPAQQGGLLYLLHRLLPFAAITFVVIVVAAVTIYVTNFGPRFRYVLASLGALVVLWLITAVLASPIEYVADNYAPVFAIAIGLLVSAIAYNQLPKVIEFLRKVG
jgi:hypothetical protein